MLTAKTSQEARLESYRMGVDEYLLKPFDETLLLTRIQNILENRKRYQRKFTLDMDVDVLNMEEESGDKKFLNQVMEVIKENYKNSYFEVSDFVKPSGKQKPAEQKTAKLNRSVRRTVHPELQTEHRSGIDSEESGNEEYEYSGSCLRSRIQ